MQPGSLVRTKYPDVGIRKGSIGMVMSVDAFGFYTVSFAALGPADQRVLRRPRLEAFNERR